MQAQVRWTHVTLAFEAAAGGGLVSPGLLFFQDYSSEVPVEKYSLGIDSPHCLLARLCE